MRGLRTCGMVFAAAALLVAAPEQVRAEGQGGSGPGAATGRTAWTFIGAGVGFGGGSLLGLRWFDDAVNSDRKVWTAAALGAVAGGVIGNRWHRRGRQAPASAGASGAQTDGLWNGMAIGAAAGAAVGLWYVPAANCQPAINPECPGILRVVVGIPAIATGAALGALADRMVGSPPAKPRGSDGAGLIVVPVIAPGGAGVFVTRTFR